MSGKRFFRFNVERGLSVKSQKAFKECLIEKNKNIEMKNWFQSAFIRKLY